MKNYEFARPKGAKDKKKRQRNTLKGHLLKGALTVGALGALSGAAGGAFMNSHKGKLKTLGGAVKGVARNLPRSAVVGATYGGGIYGARKLLAKDRSKRNFDYSRINTNTGDNNQIMFIGQIEQEGYSYDFARPKGAKDRKKRQRRSMLGTGAKIAGGLAATGAIGYAGIKNRKAIGAGLGKAGRAIESGRAATMRAGYGAAGKARQGAGAIGRGAENLRAKTARAGYSAADRVGSAVGSAKQAFKTNRQNAGKRKAQRMKIANQMRQNMG